MPEMFAEGTMSAYEQASLAVQQAGNDIALCVVQQKERELGKKLFERRSCLKIFSLAHPAVRRPLPPFALLPLICLCEAVNG